MSRVYAAAALTLLVTLLAGCAANPMRQYDTELKETVNLVKTGAVKQAIEQVEKNNTTGPLTQDKDILYYFEKGELLSLDKDYAGSRDTWLQADAIIQQWEDEYRTNPQKLFGDIGSYLISDKTRRYDGQDYEKVMLSTLLTLDHILLGNADLARIEMKKTYEREQLIKSFREKSSLSARRNTTSSRKRATSSRLITTPSVSRIIRSPNSTHRKSAI